MKSAQNRRAGDDKQVRGWGKSIRMEQQRFVFSIIIPTYNRPEKLRQCLETISRLDYPKTRFEVIVVDDGSPAGLGAVVAAFAGQLEVSYIRQANAGPAAARNTGADIARGRYLAFTDDDCQPAGDWLNLLESVLETAPDCMVGGRTVNLLAGNPFSSASQLIVDIVYRFYNADPEQARFFASNNMAMPAALLAKIGGFRPAFRTSEDRELCDRWLYNGYRMIYKPEALIYHAHDLTLLAYCKQHFNYGRGAHHFHAARAARGSGSMHKEMKFHANLENWLIYPFRRVPISRAFTLAFLLIVWQVINAAGFFWESMRVNLKEKADSRWIVP